MQYQVKDLQTNEVLTKAQKDLELQNANSNYKYMLDSFLIQLQRAQENVIIAENQLKDHRNHPPKEEEKHLEWKSVETQLVNLYIAQKQVLQDLELAQENEKEVAKKALEILEMENFSDSSKAIYQLQIKALQLKIEQYKELKDNLGIILAQKSGTVIQVGISVGERTPDNAFLKITDDSIPYQFKTTITSQERKQVEVGISVAIKLGGSQNKIEGRIRYITESDFVMEGYDVFVDLPEGIGIPNMAGSLYHANSGEKFTTVIPVDAIFVEQNKNYIYRFKEREGILGKEYYIDKMLVKIVEQNQEWIAIDSGTLEASTMIIIAANKEIKNGDTVKFENE